MWQKSWTGKRKKEKPNQMRNNPTIAFRSKLHTETLGHIKKLAKIKQKANFINQAIEMRYFYLTNKRQFLKQVLEYEYPLARHLLRIIGRRRK